MLQALKLVRSDAQSLRGKSSDLRIHYESYLQWVNNAARQLRSWVKPDDIDRLVFTQRYWLLQSRMGDTSGPLWDLIDFEVTDRLAVLEDAIAALERQIQRWSQRGVFVVADTSFYIHSPELLEDVDFAPHVHALGDPVHLLIPMIVVDELDALKESKDKHTRWRSRYTLAYLDRMLQPNPAGIALVRAGEMRFDETGQHVTHHRGDVTLEIVFDPTGHQRLPVNDDELVDRAAAIQVLAGREVHFLTYDTGQSTRAAAAGLRVHKLSQEPEGEDPASG